MTEPAQPEHDLAAWVDVALDLDPEARRAWLDGMARTDPSLAREVARVFEREAELDARGFLNDAPGIEPLDTPSIAGQQLGPYTLLRPLGRGGMGSVWLARRSDGRYEGEVAIKLLNLSLLDPIGRERFRREGHTLARLTHPNITRLIDAGVSSLGQPYLVLERVDGEPIDAYCDRHRLSPEDRLRLARQVLGAVAHAHASLVVHRDLKPSNVLVTADGTVKLLDFGIAKLLEADTGSAEPTELTGAGGALLTPEFAAPEQVTGAPITAATDVYALGVLLYLLLTGGHPTAGHDRRGPGRLHLLLDREAIPLAHAVTDAAAERRSATTRRLRKVYGGDLGTIVAKALEADPDRRYPTASALRDDLDRYLRHEPVHARPAGVGYRTRKFIRRNRILVTLAAVAASALLAATTFAWTQMVEAQRQRDVAQVERDRAVFEERRAAASSGFMLSLLSGIHPSERVTTTELIERARQLLERDHPGDPRIVAGMLLDISEELGSSVALATRAALLAAAAEHADQAADAELQLAAQCASARFYVRSTLDPDRAAPFLARAATIARAGPTPAPIESSCLLARAHALALGLQSDSAVGLLLRVDAAEAQRPDSLSSSAAHTQIEVGELFAILGRFERAIAGQRRAQRILEQLGRANTMQYLTSLHGESRWLQSLGLRREADSVFARWKDLATRLGPAFALVVSNSSAHHALQNGHADEAVRLFAARVESRAGTGEAPELLAQAWLCRALVAAGRLREAKDCVAALPPAGPFEIDFLQARAAVADATGESRLALEHYMEILRQDGYPTLRRPLAFMYVLNHAARAAHASAADSLADTLAGYGLDVVRRHYPEARTLEARLFGVRARARLALGDSGQALQLGTQAIRQFALLPELLTNEAAERDSVRALLAALSRPR